MWPPCLRIPSCTRILDAEAKRAPAGPRRNPSASRLKQTRRTPVLGELSEQEIDAVLRAETLGRIGCHARDMTYVVPVSYVYDGYSAYVLSAEGLKLQLMRENPRVCFEVEQIRHWTNWRTVIAWGRFEELEGQEAQEARALLNDRLTPIMAFEAKLAESDRPLAPGVAERTLKMCRIRLDQRSGRFERLLS
jgi:hypothetical protein